LSHSNREVAGSIHAEVIFFCPAQPQRRTRFIHPSIKPFSNQTKTHETALNFDASTDRSLRDRITAQNLRDRISEANQPLFGTPTSDTPTDQSLEDRFSQSVLP
jgi:hypothetical protein